MEVEKKKHHMLLKEEEIPGVFPEVGEHPSKR